MIYRKFLTKPDGRAMCLYSRRPIADSIEATNPPHDPVHASSHLRWHPLRGEWVAYASHRQNRTFLPPREYSPLAVTRSKELPTEMPPGDYDVAVFENLFPTLSEASSDVPNDMPEGLHVPVEPGQGVCEVVVFTQNPDTSLGSLAIDEIELVLHAISERSRDIGAREHIQYVLPFENRGVEVGVTLHHPHGQLYAYPFVPPVPARLLAMQKEHWTKTGRGLLSDFIGAEVADGRRVISRGDGAIAFIPVCARYPYETWIAPERPVPWLHELTDEEFRALAARLKTVLTKFDRLFDKPFPYLMVLFQAPFDGGKYPEAHVHFQIYPALRSRDRLKYLAGTEIGGGMFANDSIPEEKAAELRAVQES